MSRIKVRFSFNDEEWKKYQDKLEVFPEKVKKATNTYFHKDVKSMMIKSITGEMPISNKNKPHAKHSEWFVSFNFDQAITIENKLRGTKKTSFYYLIFPHEGTSRILKPNPFMQRAVDKEHNKIVTGLFNVIDREIEEELI